MTHARKLMIALALLAGPSALRAEPIPWNYLTTVTFDGGPAWTAALPNHVLSGGTANTTTTAEIWGDSGGFVPERGSRVITVGEAHPGAQLSPDSRLLTQGVWASSFNMLFDLQDARSGERGALRFTAGVVETDTVTAEAPYLLLTRSESISVREPSGDTPWLASATLRLGENDYRVDLKERQDGFGTAFIDADVRVAAVHETPEPATLLLGGIGLVGVALGWRRKRRLATDDATE